MSDNSNIDKKGFNDLFTVKTVSQGPKIRIEDVDHSQLEEKRKEIYAQQYRYLIIHD